MTLPPIRRTQAFEAIEAPIARRFGLMAEPLRFLTNDERIAAAAEAALGRFAVPTQGEPLEIRLVVDPALPSGGADPEAIRHHIAGRWYHVNLAAEAFAITDTIGGRAAGWVSDAVADAADLVRVAFVEGPGLSMLARARAYTAIHAACVVRDGIGLVIQASAGTGKSTLAIAAARRGIGVLAEDVVFLRRGADHVELWGAPWVHRLLPDAPRWFPELAGRAPVRQPNGEHKIPLEVDTLGPGLAVPTATPGPVVLLARGTGGPTRLEPLTGPEAAAAFEVHWPWDGGWTEVHERAVRDLLAGGVVRLHMNGAPDEAVDLLERVFEEHRATSAAGRAPG